MSILQFQDSLAVLFVIFPFSAVLSLLRFEYPIAFLFVTYPIAVIVYIFKVIVLSQTVLLSVHPLPIVNFLFLALTPPRFSQEHSSTVLLVLFELAAVLQILFTEVIDPIALDPLTPPCAYVHISIWKSVLSLDQLPSLVFVILGLCGCVPLWRPYRYIFYGVIRIVRSLFILHCFSS